MGLLPGVYTAKKKNGTIYYRSSITYRKKHISLGSFEQEEKAHRAYKEASFLLNHQEVSLSSYDENSFLSHDKWVSLLNFRDNHVYFKNPLYLKRNYFLYYLNSHMELKFDIDDLFYYANHKIMARKGHLFVADYGMQVNILGRYGIKNYGVEGVDYVFMNGDSTDFRYENISIINRFQGVRQKEKNGKIFFQAKILLHGCYLIGNYSSEIEAAIAYNKAIDTVKKNGCKKNFSYNYIESYTPSQYEECYRNLSISKKIVHYKPLYNEQ